MLGRKGGPEHVGPHSYHGPGVQHGIDPCSTVVAHQGAHEEGVRSDRVPFRKAPDLHFTVVVLQVACVGVRSEVAPFADHAVPHETIVSLIAEAMEHAVGHFATHLAVRSDGGGSVDLGTHLQLRMLITLNRLLFNFIQLELYQFLFLLFDRLRIPINFFIFCSSMRFNVIE